MILIIDVEDFLRVDELHLGEFWIGLSFGLVEDHCLGLPTAALKCPVFDQLVLEIFWVGLIWDEAEVEFGF